MNLVGTNKIADYINHRPKARLDLLIWLKEYPYSEGPGKFSNLNDFVPTECGGGVATPGTGSYSVRYRINYAAKSVYINWVGSKEELEQERVKELKEIRMKHPNETFKTVTVTLKVPQPKNYSKSFKANKVVEKSSILDSTNDNYQMALDSHSIINIEANSLFTTEAEYFKALIRAGELFEGQPGSSQFDELLALLPMIQQYEQAELKFPAMRIQEIIQHRMNIFKLPSSYVAAKVGSEDKFNNFLNGDIALPASILKNLYKKLGLRFPISDQRFY